MIGSMHKLAAVGMHQRLELARQDCYTSKGVTAIACMFIDGIRWTVELSRNADDSVTVTDICSAHYIAPLVKVKNRVLAALGLGEEEIRYGRSVIRYWNTPNANF